MEKNKSIINMDDLRFVLKIAFKNWYWFVVFPLLAAVIAYFYTYQLPRIYTAKTEILLKSGDTYDYQDKLLGGLGGNSIYALYGDITNQKRVINSHDLIGRVIDKLDFGVSYYIEGRLKTDQKYKNIPFSIDVKNITSSLYQKWFGFKIMSVDSFEITFPSIIDKAPIKGKFGETLYDTELVVYVGKRDGIQLVPGETQYLFVPHSRSYLINKYKRIKISNVKYTSILSLRVNDEIPRRAVDFLDTLSAVYIDYTLQSRIDKNVNTLKYINKQMGDISEVIKQIEVELGGQNTLGIEGDEIRSSLVEQLAQLEITESAISRKEAQVNLLDSFLVHDRGESLPMMYAVDGDAFINAGLTQLYTLDAQKYTQSFAKTESSIETEQLDYEKRRIKKELLVYNAGLRKKIELERKEVLNKKLEKEGMLRQMPKDERELLNIERKLKINQNLYNFLIEQRAKLIIARAGIIPESKVLEKGRSLGKVSPNENQIMLTFVVVGIIIALIITGIRLLFFDRIESVGELKSLTDSPVLGGIPQTDIQTIESIEENNYLRTPVAESFRNIRANIQYLSPGDNAKVIMVTSLHPGEGKTFNSVNIASIFARANKKVLLLDFDMHKPRVHKFFGMTNQFGLSTFLTGMTGYKEHMQESPIENLEVLTAGPVPPNASELILSARVAEIINAEKENYDFIILDTPPVLLISDSMILTNHTDVNIYVMNTKKATRHGVRLLNEVHERHPDKVHAVILNQVRVKRFGYYYGKYQYAYGGYSYGYGYGYGQENKR